MKIRIQILTVMVATALLGAVAATSLQQAYAPEPVPDVPPSRS
jgi:hypothetical protein